MYLHSNETNIRKSEYDYQIVQGQFSDCDIVLQFCEMLPLGNVKLGKVYEDISLYYFYNWL